MNRIGTYRNDRIVGDDGVNLLDGNLGNDTLIGGEAADILRGGDDYPFGAEDFATGVGHDLLEGRGGDDDLDGGYGNDTLIGGDGNDLLDGGDLTFLDNDLYNEKDLSVSDSLVGGAGNDTYIVDAIGDVVVEAAGQGVDEVRSHISHTLAANVERLILVGSAALDGAGNALANTLVGNAAANRLDGGGGHDSIAGSGGNDTLIGGTGDDTLVAGPGTVQVQGGDGADVVRVEWGGLSGATFALEDVVKRGSSYSGTYLAKNGRGAVVSAVAFADIERLSAGGQNVNLDPPADPAVRIVRSGTATATTEQGGTVVFAVSLATAPFEDVTVDFSVGDATEARIANRSLTFTPGNWSAPQTLTIEGVDDFLDDGNVAYTVTGKIDTSDLTYNRVKVPVINLINNDDGEDDNRIINGTDKTDYLEGANGDDRIYGKGGQDQLSGRIGNDRLYGENDNDRLYGDTGNDQLYGGYDDDTLDGGVGNDSLFGEQGLDTLIGGAGNDYLDGGIENDSMSGGAGNDTYFIDSAGDKINDLGLTTDVDTVLLLQTVSYALPANVENASINAAAGNASLTGNGLDNRLAGNDSRNVLDGGQGDDVLAGGGGNDTMRGGAGVDVADFAAAGVNISIDLNTGRAEGEGTDLIFGIENILAGDGRDTLLGNAAGNDLDGGAGTDNLNGGGGNDTLAGCFFGANGGRGEIDTLTGGAGVDVYQVGFASGRFYDDGNTRNAGRNDYVVITDFTVGQDKLQLDGARSNYYLGQSGVNGVSGIGLYAEQGATDELVAIIRSANSTTLTAANTINAAQFV